MLARDRVTGLSLLVLAIATWAGVAWLLVERSPIGQPLIQLTGAVAMGVGVGITLWPLLWLASYARQRTIAYRGDWSRAAVQGGQIDDTVSVLVMLRGQSSLSLPLAAFVITLALLMEVAFSLRR